MKWTINQAAITTFDGVDDTTVTETTLTLQGDDPDDLASLADLQTLLESLVTSYGVTAINAMVSNTVQIVLHEPP